MFSRLALSGYAVRSSSSRLLAPHWANYPNLNVRFNSTDAGKSDVEKLKSETDVNDSKQSAEITGVMDYLKLTEVLMFIDNVYPRWLTKLSYSRYFSFLKKFRNLFNDDKLKDRVNKLIQSDKKTLPVGTKCEEFVPFRRDGGAFVKFLVPPTSNLKELTETIEQNIQDNKAAYELIAGGLLTLFRSYPRAYRVKGTPWIEDLSRFPSSQLKVKFDGMPLTEEELYLLFRRYGLIIDIIPISSSTPYATIIFKTTDACIRAKNCLTGMVLNEGKTSLHLQYIPRQSVNHIKDFIVNHQRIAIPVLLALLATIAVFIFEPIREQFIEFKIRHVYSLDAHKDNWFVKAVYTPYRLVVSSINDGRHFLDDSIGLLRGKKKDSPELENLDADMFWSERTEKANQVKLWVCENANTFIIVKGPKGSGKREFVVEHALHLNEAFLKRVLEIDCDTLIKSRSDNAFLKSTASQLGYFPLFTWTNSISSFVDLGLQGLTGQKSGFSESKETQFKNMLLLTLVAIRKVALANFDAFKCEYEHQQQKKTSGDSVDKFVDIKEDDYLQLNPEAKPVIVINNFLRKAESSNDFIYKGLAEWAGQLIQSNTAHVIFITLDSGSTLHLTAALPNQVFKSISLADASLASARQYVSLQLQSEKNIYNLDECLEPIGGRMLDLQAFVRRVKSGESANDALKEMIHQAAEQITTFFLNISENPSAGSDVTWNTAQIWALMRVLAKEDSILFGELVKSPLFTSSYDTVSTLSVLEKNDLIALKRDKGIVSSITTGRPLYKAAFEELVSDEKVFKVYETYFYNALIKLENAKIAKLEDEIAKIGGLSDLKLMKERLEYVAKKISASTDKVLGYEQQVKEIQNMSSQPKKTGLFGF
ncbi:CIC11C00000002240 [Sungouiella intermedia]|uniref:Mitochondrial escape protein 2 n=1 Tax=Sungouiella intermedia TaxID=45354 RepID=A0A1L0G3W2_9ASCO|nr:CIC11C00000002240 [[Candida] intermedia]